MKTVKNIRKTINSSLFLFLTFILLSNLIFATSKSSTIFSNINIKKYAENQVNISATLSSFVLPESKQTLTEYAQTGMIDSSLISSNYALTPVVGKEVIVDLIDPLNPEHSVKLCSWVTDNEGNGHCIAAVTLREATIRIKFNGSESLYQTQGFGSIFSPSVIPFKEIIDPTWLVIFLFIGVLAAALYAAGKNPIDAFDITTPKVRGIKSPEIPKLKFSTSTGTIKTNIIAPLTTGFYKAKNISISSLPTVNALERNIPSDKKNELKDIYVTRSEQERMLLIAKKINELGVRNKLINGLATAKSAIKSLQKRKEKLNLIQQQAKTSQERTKLEVSKKRIDDLIANYTKQVEAYERDLKNLSGLTLARKMEIDKIDPEKVKTFINSTKNVFIDEYSKIVKNPQYNPKPDFFEKVKESIAQRAKKEFPESIELSEKINNIAQTKLELDRLYFAKLSRALNQINKNELEILEDPEDSIHYKAIKSPSTSEIERTDSIVEILNKYNKSEAIKLEEEMKIINTARRDIDRSINKFLSSVHAYKYGEEKTREQNAFNSLISFSILITRSEGFLADIENRTKDFYSDSPIFDENIAKTLLSIYKQRKSE